MSQISFMIKCIKCKSEFDQGDTNRRFCLLCRYSKDKAQRKRYLDRHRDRENWNVPDTAGSLSARILWGPSTSKRENIRLFKNKFNLK